MPHAPTNYPRAGSPTRTVRTRLALLILCFGLAACGSTAKNSAASSETTTAATSQDSGTSSSTPATSGKAPAPVKVCSVLPVSGLGDKAFSARDGLHALFGDRLILVAGLSTVPPAEAIVMALQAKLP